MRIPSIHLNGTSQKELFGGYLEAARAVRAAIEAVQATGPNGRDYYPQGGDALHDAIAEHASRVQKLRSVLSELETIAEAIVP